MIGPSIGPCCYQVDAGMADLGVRELPPHEQCLSPHRAAVAHV